MKIGDKVSVLDEDLEGKVISIKNGMVNFEDEYGFLHQYPLEKLVSKDENFYEEIEIKSEKEKIHPKWRKQNQTIEILDLHFDKIKEKTSADGFERLLIQKEKLIKTLEYCRKHKIRKLKIIHGIGDGIVQGMVVEILKSSTGIDFYHTEILPEQSGAIMVEFT